MKHFLSLVYVAALALMLSTGASAREITVDGMVLKTNRTAKIATFTKLAKPSDSKWKNQVTIPATVTDGDVKCSVTKIDAGALYEHTTKAVSIPSTVTEIGSYAFYKTEFTEITLPSGLKTLGEGVFKDSKLQKVTIPASVTSIGDYAFSSPNFIKIAFKARTANLTIGMGVFWHAGITSLTLPSTLTTVPNSAFGGNPELTTVNFSRGLVSIEEGGFGNTGIKSLNLPASLKTIGNIAFTLVKITELTLPGNVTTIGAKAFYDCPNLAKVNLPASVTSIGAQAFDECREIKFVASANPNPPVLGTDCFYWSVYDNADLMLSSDAAIERYKVANEWKRFNWLANAGIGDVEADAEVDPELPCTVYNLNGSLVTTCEADELDRLPSGVYVVRQGDKVTKICK